MAQYPKSSIDIFSIVFKDYANAKTDHKQNFTIHFKRREAMVDEYYEGN